MSEMLCEILIQKKVLSETAAEHALQLHRRQPGKRFDRLLVEMNLAPEPAVLEAVACYVGLPFVSLEEDQAIERDAIRAVPARLVYRYGVIPIALSDGTVTLACSDPLNSAAWDDIRVKTGLNVDVVVASGSQISQLIKREFGVGGQTVGQLVGEQNGRADEQDSDYDEEELAQEASVVRLVNEILVDAIRERASDVHIEPEEDGLKIRSRIDGVLRQQVLPPGIDRLRAAIVSRLKIMARLNIAEKRLPQDGRIKMQVEGREIDIRVSVIPMVHGEGVVLRILDRSQALFSLQQIGMDDYAYGRFRELIQQPHGIILVTGPTGSGKSTTLYSALCEIKSERTKIITVEDPVEYQIAGISQIQVQSKIGLTFARCLRSILRHDPDVVLVGEIRDRETAEIAMEAAMTGHLVFSTLHTNDAAGAFGRLTDMGIEPYLVASTIEGVLAQRLVRVICPECKRPHLPSPEELPPDFPGGKVRPLYRGAGCSHCRGTGYYGRTGIYEMLVPGSTIRAMIMKRANSGQIMAEAMRRGMVPLRTAGYLKALDGITTLEEVVRVTKLDQDRDDEPETAQEAENDVEPDTRRHKTVSHGRRAAGRPSACRATDGD